MLGVWLPVVLACGSLLPLTASADVPPASGAEQMTVEQRRMVIDGKTIGVQVARVPLQAYRMKVSLARGQVGATEPIAERVALAGRERYLAGRFAIGRRAAYRLVIKAHAPTFWENVQEAIECGPRLLRGGEVSVDALAEGFSHPKIVTLSLPRSAIGVTRGGMLLLVTSTSASIVDLARVMRALGAHDAMNLDGGASSGLWMDGRYVTTPGRDISHALVILRRQ